jgi:antitoxin component YwqK of YwqJK toxin-antitoxin module
MKTIQPKLNASFWIVNAISAIFLSSCAGGGLINIIGVEPPASTRNQSSSDNFTRMNFAGMSCKEESLLSASDEQQTEQVIAENVRKEAVYYPTGELKEIRNYSKETHKQHGKWETYYQNGQVESVVNYEDGKKNGKEKGYYEGGQLAIIGNYENGKPEGKIIEYYKNGQIKRVANVKDEKLDGIYKECDENGQLWTAGNYIDGKKDGEWKEKRLVSINGMKVVGAFSTTNGKVDGRYGSLGGDSNAYGIDQRTHNAEYKDIIVYYKNGNLIR